MEIRFSSPAQVKLNTLRADAIIRLTEELARLAGSVAENKPPRVGALLCSDFLVAYELGEDDVMTVLELKPPPRR